MIDHTKGRENNQQEYQKPMQKLVLAISNASEAKRQTSIPAFDIKNFPHESISAGPKVF